MTDYIDWRARVTALQDGLRDPDLTDTEKQIGRRYSDELRAAGEAYEATISKTTRIDRGNNGPYEEWSKRFEAFARSKPEATFSFCYRAAVGGAEALGFTPTGGIEHWGDLADGEGGWVHPEDERQYHSTRLEELARQPGYAANEFCQDIVEPARLALRALPYDPGEAPPQATPTTIVTITPTSAGFAAAEAALAAVVVKVDAFIALEELA